MNEKTNISKQPTAATAEPENIMRGVQEMIEDLLKNAVHKMHNKDTHEKLGDASAGADHKSEQAAQPGIAEIKNFVSVMQKFIDNVNVMVAQLEMGSLESGGTDEQILEGYMATADNVLEIAAFSMKDAITGLSNRYGFDNRLILEFNRAARDKSDLSLVIFSVNDFEGGEDEAKRKELLKAISGTLEKSIKRATDFIARWGEDEFTVLLPLTNVAGALIVAERITAEMGNMDIPGTFEKGGKHSVSAGVCTHTADTPYEKPVDFINKAHDAYTKAKEASGSSIVVV